MPLYEYKCSCGERFERVRPMAESTAPAICPVCAAEAPKILSAPAVRGDYPGYECPKTGRWIEGRKAHEENLRRTGSRLWEPGETEKANRRRAAEEAEFDRQVDETLDRTLLAMGPDKVAKLCNEVAAGADVQVVRETVGN